MLRWNRRCPLRCKDPPAPWELPSRHKTVNKSRHLRDRPRRVSITMRPRGQFQQRPRLLSGKTTMVFSGSHLSTHATGSRWNIQFAATLSLLTPTSCQATLKLRTASTQEHAALRTNTEAIGCSTRRNVILSAGHWRSSTHPCAESAV